MLSKGLVLKIEKQHMVVLTDDQDYVRIRLKDHAVIGQRIYFTEEDLYHSAEYSMPWHSLNSKKVLRIASLFFVFVFLAGLWNYDPQKGATAPVEAHYIESLNVATVVTIDINPRVMLSLDSNHQVISVKALNLDALALSRDNMVGLSVESALEKIVIVATDKGFINSTDLIDDYILITTIPMALNPQLSDTLKSRLEGKIAESEVLSTVHVAFIEGTKESLRIAENKKVPLGLYMINPNITAGHKDATVKDFFKQTDNLKAFKDKGEIITQKDQQQRKQIEKIISKLKAEGIDVSIYEANLKLQNPDLKHLLSRLESHWSTVEKQLENAVKENTPTAENEKDKKNPKAPDNGNQKKPSQKHKP